MHRVALTGNIASGKSAVAGVWTGLGAHVVDADLLARHAVEPGSAGLDAVVDRFGDRVLGADGRLDRDALRRIVFADAEARRDLERILHPRIGRLREEQDRRLAEAGVAIVVHVIPLLFEVGLESEFDDVVFVDAPAGLRLRRLVDLRGLTEAEARAMIDAQLPAAAKRAAATLVIDNAGSLDMLERTAVEAWHEIERRAGSARKKRR